MALICYCSFTNVSLASENSCLGAIEKYEKLYHIPKGLLKAVSKVESEYNPLALNDGNSNYNFKNKNEVLDKLESLIGQGKTNVDVGCMQINYYWHGKYFSNLAEMIDVNNNVRYAAAHLFGLHQVHGTWLNAVRHYHSYEPTIHKQYSKKVSIAWLQEDDAINSFKIK